MSKKLTNDAGKVAVLISPGFGAGWSTWSRNKDCLFDPVVAQWVIDGKPANKRPVVSELYGEDFYDGGMDDLEIHWMEPGTAFRVEEYDGAESVVFSYEDWNVA